MLPEVFIRSIKVRALNVPMPQPHRTSNGVIHSSPLVLTDIVTSEGTTGHSVLFAYSSFAVKPAADLVVSLGELLVGKALAPQVLTDSLADKVLLLGQEGLAGMAIAALDMAMWDGLARTLGLALHRLLGASSKTLRTYGSIGFDGSAGCADGVVRLADAGFKGAKVKIGYPTIQEDREVLGAMRQNMPAGMALMVDYNQSLTTAEAIYRIRRLEEFDLTWVEEPVSAHDLEASATVARNSEPAIQSGESWWGAGEVSRALASGASDLLMLDAMKVGGVTGWQRAASLAKAYNLKVSSHLWPELSAQLLCASPTADWLEYADWWNPILVDPLRIDCGMVNLGNAVGSGMEWNETRVSEYLL